MIITKEVEETQVIVEADGQLSVLEATWYAEDGIRVGTPTHHYRLIDVGDDTTAESPLVKDVVKNLHTPARKAARKAEKDKQAVPPVVTPDPQ